MNFSELAENLGLELDEYKELIELFIDTGSADFHKIEEALVDRNADQLMRSAHTIKGAAGNLGLMQISATARDIEDLAVKNLFDLIDPSLQILRTQIEAITVFAHG